MNPDATCSLVWFKRDLRCHDHQPLFEAAQYGPCVALYIYEPELINAEDADASHLEFINGCLAELQAQLRNLGGELITRTGRAHEVLALLHQQVRFDRIYSHQETGNKLTYDRDRRVAAWARSNQIPWHQYRQQGVLRGLKDRDGWAALWNRDMSAAQCPAVKHINAGPQVESHGIQSPQVFGLAPSGKSHQPPPGERAAHDTLRSFLHQRGEDYQRAMSSPEAGAASCSRLSPYLAYGAISMRSVYQTYRERIEQLRDAKREGVPNLSQWIRSLSSFNKRLHWNGHFIQRLESDPSIEFHSLVRAFEGLRDEPSGDGVFEAWVEGRTGFPMVDACMRSLAATGWLNFRMRAMVVSFASYHLWLPWRQTGLYLARQFLDYEPGIHYNQLQMQSGVTGINAVRIYSPTKQATDHDPQGTFIRRWVPELEAVPVHRLAQPHTLDMIEQSETSFRVGIDYPLPIVDHAEAVAQAKQRIFAVRRTADAKEQAARVLERHGSRRRAPKRRRSR